MTNREDERMDLPVDEDTALEDPVTEDATRIVGEEIDPDSVRPLAVSADDDELVLAPEDDEVRRGL